MENGEAVYDWYSKCIRNGTNYQKNPGPNGVEALLRSLGARANAVRTEKLRSENEVLQRNTTKRSHNELTGKLKESNLINEVVRIVELSVHGFQCIMKVVRWLLMSY